MRSAILSEGGPSLWPAMRTNISEELVAAKEQRQKDCINEAILAGLRCGISCCLTECVQGAWEGRHGMRVA